MLKKHVIILIQPYASTDAGATFPGHIAMVGSLIPPSYVVSFPHRNGPLLPPRVTDITIHSRFNMATWPETTLLDQAVIDKYVTAPTD